MQFFKKDAYKTQLKIETIMINAGNMEAAFSNITLLAGNFPLYVLTFFPVFTIIIPMSKKTVIIGTSATVTDSYCKLKTAFGSFKHGSRLTAHGSRLTAHGSRLNYTHLTKIVSTIQTT